MSARSHLKAAIRADLHYLFKRIPNDSKDQFLLDCQIREMRAAEPRARMLGVLIPWDYEPWHGYVLLPDGTTDVPEPRKSAKVKSSTTGKRRIKTGEA
jgi:hypothetical protein